jgi:acetaldehyde dehydrogenase (acetylating)
MAAVVAHFPWRLYRHGHHWQVRLPREGIHPVEDGLYEAMGLGVMRIDEGLPEAPQPRLHVATSM